jgi:sugar phosphate isomerase/epimerase
VQVAVMGHCLNALLPEAEPIGRPPGPLPAERTIEGRVRAAAEAGIAAVEPFGGVWPAAEECRRTAERVRAEGDRRGVRFPAYGSNLRLGDPAALPGLLREVEACAILGASVMTVPILDAQPVAPEAAPGLGLPFERAVAMLVPPLAELAAAARERGVRIGVLSHGALVFLSWHQEWLARLVDHPAVGVTTDPGNCLYYGGEEPEAAARRLAGRTCLVRAGDWRPRPEAAVREEFARSGRLAPWESVPLGDGDVDHRRCLAILRAAGFDGVVSLKSPGPPLPDARTALLRAVARLNEWIAEGDRP